MKLRAAIQRTLLLLVGMGRTNNPPIQPMGVNRVIVPKEWEKAWPHNWLDKEHNKIIYID